MNVLSIQKRDNFEGKVRPINLDTDSKKLADYFNAIDDLWPGTWTQGLPYDEKRAREFIEIRNALETFVAFDPQDRLVGMCSVHKRMEEPNVSYIGVLGAHPDVLGKKYGKHLLLKALDFSIKNGDVRQDLHTWPSNLKAVPLYKKVGLQWVPNTSVYMQNYIPAILQNSFCKSFFKKHPDWYLNQIREITQAPDDLTFENMKVFKYRFEKGEDFLEVIVDRYSRSITGVKRKLDGDLLSFMLQQERHEVFTGIDEDFSLVIENDTAEDLSVIVSFEGSKEIQISSNQGVFTIPKGKKTFINTFTVSDTSPDSEISRKSPSIKSRINMGEEFLTLEVGMKVRQLVDIFSSETSWWVPSGKHILPLNIQNRSTQPLKGELLLWSNNKVSVSNPITPIELASEENIGVAVQLEVVMDVEDDISTTLFCQVRMEDTISRVFEIPIFISNNPGLAAGLQEDKKRVILQNQNIRAVIPLEGASANVSTPDGTIMGIGANILDFGPPFGFSEFSQVEFSPKITKTTKSIQVRLSKRSQRKPSLVFHRIFELRPGDTHLALWEEVENLGTVNDQVTTILQPRFIDGINMPLGETYFVFDGQLVSGPGVVWPTGKGDLPKGTDRYEPWICVQVDDVAYYHIYETDNTTADPSRGKLSTLEKFIRISALSSSRGPKSWIGCGKLDWERVRDLSYYLSKKQLLTANQKLLKPISFLSVNIPDNQRLIGANQSKLSINLNSIRYMPLNGQLIIHTPEGWHAKPKTFDINNLSLTNPHEFTCEIHLPKNIEFGTYMLDFEIKTTAIEKTEQLPFLVYTASDRPTIQDLDPVEGKKLVSVKNNFLQIVSSVDFAGSLIQIKHNKEDFLISNFPNFAPSLIFSKDPGGFATLILGNNDTLDDLKYIDEKYTISKSQQDPWYGVEHTVTIHELKSLKGLVMKTAYELLSGNSKLVRIRISIHNPTSAFMQFASFSLLRAGIDGSIEDMVSRFSIGGSTPFRFSRDNPIPIITIGAKTLSHLSFEKNGNSLSLIKTSPFSRLFPLEASKMILGAGVFHYWSLEPNETDEVIYFLAIDNANETFLKEVNQIFNK